MNIEQKSEKINEALIQLVQEPPLLDTPMADLVLEFMATMPIKSKAILFDILTQK